MRGLDPALRQKLRARGYRVVLVPNEAVAHPVPGTVRGLARMFFRNGRGSAFAQRHHPEIVFDTEESTARQAHDLHVPLRGRLWRFPLRAARHLLTGRIVRFLGDIVYAAGYVFELAVGVRPPPRAAGGS